MKGPTPRRFWDYVMRCLGLGCYFCFPGDGRPRPQIPAKTLLWSLLMGQLLRASSFLAVERLVCSTARRSLVVSQAFGDDALAYFTERLNPDSMRDALAQILRQAKRNKAFETCGGIGLAVDGTTVGRCAGRACSLCRPHCRDHQIVGYRHHLVLASVVGSGLVLPFDVPTDRAIANTLADSGCCVGPWNGWESVLLLMWLWMESMPRLLFSMRPPT